MYLADVIRTINSFHDVHKFSKEYRVKITSHADGRHILNYDEKILNTPKNWITHFCRSLTIAGEPGQYYVVANAFPRFYNEPEDIEYLGTEDDIDWTKPFDIHFKYDGSLILAYLYKGELCIATRGSFANSSPSPDTEKTWRELFLESNITGNLPKIEGHTHVFELCTPYNQIVEFFPESFSVQLATFARDGSEIQGQFQGTTYKASSKEEVLELIKTLKPIQEGFVVAQWDWDRRQYKRKKFKTSTWAKLAHMKKGLSSDTLWDIVFNGEDSEIISLFPNLQEKLTEYRHLYEKTQREIEVEFNKVKDIEHQKDFAASVKGLPIAPVLFRSRQRGTVDLMEVQKFLRKREG